MTSICPCRGDLEQRRVPLLESLEILGLIVGLPVHPTAVQDTDPLERKSPERGVPGRSLRAMKTVELLRPRRLRDARRRPLHERLADELGRSIAPVHPALLAASLEHRRNTRVPLERSRIREALSDLAEGSQQPSRENRPRPRQLAEDLVVGELGTLASHWT
jgi:hypothetical protein